MNARLWMHVQSYVRVQDLAQHFQVMGVSEDALNFQCTSDNEKKNI